MMDKYVFLGNCLAHPKCREAMIKYIQGRFKPGSEDNFINGLLGEYIAEMYLKSMKICKDMHINKKQDFIYSSSDPHQYLEAEPDFWDGEIGYDVKTTKKAFFSQFDKNKVLQKAKDEGARYVVLLSNFDYSNFFGTNAHLSIVSVDAPDEIVIKCNIPDDFIHRCFYRLELIAIKEELANGQGLN